MLNAVLHRHSNCRDVVLYASFHRCYFRSLCVPYSPPPSLTRGASHVCVAESFPLGLMLPWKHATSICISNEDRLFIGHDSNLRCQTKAVVSSAWSFVCESRQNRFSKKKKSRAINTNYDQWRCKNHTWKFVCVEGGSLFLSGADCAATVLICEFSPDLWLCCSLFFFFFLLLLLLSASTVTAPRPSARRLKGKQSQGN